MNKLQEENNNKKFLGSKNNLNYSIIQSENALSLNQIQNEGEHNYVTNLSKKTSNTFGGINANASMNSSRTKIIHRKKTERDVG